MDYRDVAEKLRRKANDPAVGPEESRALLDKAIELEGKAGPPPKQVTYSYVYISKSQPRTVVKTVPVDPWPPDWYVTMEQWADTSDWYSGAE